MLSTVVFQGSNLGIMELNGSDLGCRQMTLLFVNPDCREIGWHSLEEVTAADEADCWALVVSLLTMQVRAMGD